jgi:hypothetical protein
VSDFAAKEGLYELEALERARAFIARHSVSHPGKQNDPQCGSFYLYEFG